MSDRPELSLRLNDVLEMVGVTEEMRSFHRRRATMCEILENIYVNRNSGKPYDMFKCGSNWEGSVTPDLASDVDTIGYPREPLVVTHPLMAGPGEYFQMVREEWTRPGYVKLQLMRDGRPLTVNDVELSDTVGFDGEGRACRKHLHLTFGTMNGPATAYIDDDGQHQADTVHSFQCKGIPLFATDWITRHRRYGWPSQELIDELKMMGCLFVGVGHFESQDKDLEWRVSFSLQERMLMGSLNIIQHRVYVLLKMIRKDILEKSLNGESLSSYHCKTCVFYMAETTPASMWVPENLINCVLQCLTLLLRWVNNKVCPSFFMKDSNLFDKEGFVRLADPLERLIDSLLQTGHQFLYWLQSDRVGEMLRDKELRLYKPVADSSIKTYIFKLDQHSIVHIIITFRGMSGSYNSEQDSLSLYTAELEELQHGESFPCHTEEEYRDALQLVLPWLHLSIGLVFAARAATCKDVQLRKVLLENANIRLQQAKNTDLVNERLAKATILLRLEKLEECFLLLQELENCWTYRVVTLCPCTDDSILLYSGEQQKNEMASECTAMSLRKVMTTRYASCVIFERSQIQLAPSPLSYEMNRSLYTYPGSRHDFVEEWFDRAAVDAKVYLYLMQYMVCAKLNREPHKQIAIDNLAYMIYKPKVLHHRETAFNLLGWIYLQENRVADAEWCFFQSWKIRPHHNAVKFHMLGLCLKLKEERETT